MIFGKIYTVTEVNKIVKGLIHEEPEFANLQIQGKCPTSASILPATVISI